MEFTRDLNAYEHAQCVEAFQWMTKKKVRRAKDGRVIAPRKTASAGRNKKEQLWKVEDLDRAFDLWERNKDLPPKERWSKNKIA